jgi:hypothetical protein
MNGMGAPIFAVQVKPWHDQEATAAVRVAGFKFLVFWRTPVPGLVRPNWIDEFAVTRMACRA